MHAARWLAAYLALVCGPIALLATDCTGKLDNQSDNGSRIVRLKGDAEVTFPPDSPNFGTYRTKATDKSQRKGCRWRLLVPIPNRPGKYFQTSPKKAGAWHHLNKYTYTGRVRIRPVTDPKYKHQPRVLDTENCRYWEMRD